MMQVRKSVQRRNALLSDGQVMARWIGPRRFDQIASRPACLQVIPDHAARACSRRGEDDLLRQRIQRVGSPAGRPL